MKKFGLTLLGASLVILSVLLFGVDDITTLSLAVYTIMSTVAIGFGTILLSSKSKDKFDIIAIVIIILLVLATLTLMSIDVVEFRTMVGIVFLEIAAAIWLSLGLKVVDYIIIKFPKGVKNEENQEYELER